MHIQGAAKKVIPCRILPIFKQPLSIFWWNFAVIFSVYTDTKLPNIVQLSWNMTKLLWLQMRQPLGFDVVKIWNRQEYITNCTNKFSLQQSITNCTFNVTLNGWSVHH